MAKTEPGGDHIKDGSIALIDMANMATASFIGRNTVGTGIPEVLAIATVKTMLDLAGSNTGDQTITLTGDVTGSGTGSFAATLAAKAVTPLAQIACSDFPNINLLTVANVNYKPFWIDGDDNVFVVGAVDYKAAINSAKVANGALQVWKFTDSAKSWTQIGGLLGNVGYAHSAACIGIDSTGNILILFLSPKSGNTVINVFAQFYNLATDTWGSVEQVSAETTAGRDAVGISLGIDPITDNFCIAFAQKNNGSTTYDQLCYCTRTAGSGGSWAAVEYLGNAPVRAWSIPIRTEIFVSNGDVWIIYFDNAAATSNKMAMAHWNTVNWTVYDSTYTMQLADAVMSNAIYIVQSGDNLIKKCTAAGNWSEIDLGEKYSQVTYDSSGNIFTYAISSSSGIIVKFDSSMAMVGNGQRSIPEVASTNLGASYTYLFNKIGRTTPVGIYLYSTGWIRLRTLTG